MAKVFIDRQEYRCPGCGHHWVLLSHDVKISAQIGAIYRSIVIMEHYATHLNKIADDLEKFDKDKGDKK